MVFFAGFMTGIGVAVLVSLCLVRYTKKPLSVSDQKRSEL